MAIDLKDYVKTVDAGAVDPQDSAFRKDSPFYDANILQLQYDPVKAQSLLDQLAAEKGGPLKFTMTTFPANNFQLAAQYIQRALSKFKNIDVSIATESSQAHQNSCNTRAFDSICHTAIP